MLQKPLFAAEKAKFRIVRNAKGFIHVSLVSVLVVLRLKQRFQSCFYLD